MASSKKTQHTQKASNLNADRNLVVNWKEKYENLVHKLAKDYEARVESSRKDAIAAQKSMFLLPRDVL